uniref:Reverse transcriptase domain-containing protein n=1 Tax=Tanacetum cinerariifolium TaxID=118510 RepID=A0A6L2KJK0_TANCI|nr:reverse transcriptase domain-containing protein [Tanacetum cinerariifolium]
MKDAEKAFQEMKKLIVELPLLTIPRKEETLYVYLAAATKPVSAVMAAPTIVISAEENLGDPIDIRVDIIHPEPIAAVSFLTVAVVRTQAQHGEAIRGMQEQLLGVPIHEELTALRFKVDIAEAENASLRARIKTTEAIKKITRNHE